jgi:putative transcriptional regulator
MKLIISNRIRKYRFENNELTQAQLAKLADCSRQTIIAIEKGKIIPSLELAFRISSIFKKNVEEVFQYSGDKRFTIFEKLE